MVGEPQVIPVGHELPAIRHSSNGSNGRHQGHQSRPKRKPTRCKTGDRFAVLNAFVDFTLRGLTRNETAVWLVLYRDTKPNGTARTGQSDIARRAGISPRSARRGIDGLCKKGLLKRTYQGGIGRGASAYRIRPFPPTGHGT